MKKLSSKKKYGSFEY